MTLVSDCSPQTPRRLGEYSVVRICSAIFSTDPTCGARL